jgi:hypothetical protein
VPQPVAQLPPREVVQAGLWLPFRQFSQKSAAGQFGDHRCQKPLNAARISATTLQREQHDPAARLGDAATRSSTPPALFHTMEGNSLIRVTGAVKRNWTFRPSRMIRALHGRSRMCTRHGYLLCGWRRCDGFQWCGGVDPGDRTAGPGLDRGRGWRRRVVLQWRLVGHPDGVFGDRGAGGFLRHPSIGWAGDDSGADSRCRRVDAGDCLASDPDRDGLRTRAGLPRRRPGRDRPRWRPLPTPSRPSPL